MLGKKEADGEGSVDMVTSGKATSCRASLSPVMVITPQIASIYRFHSDCFLYSPRF